MWVSGECTHLILTRTYLRTSMRIYKSSCWRCGFFLYAGLSRLGRRVMWNVGHGHVLLAAARPAVITRRARKGPGPHSIANLHTGICRWFATRCYLTGAISAWRPWLPRSARASRRDDTRISGSDDDNWEGNPGNRHLYKVGADKKPPAKFAPIICGSQRFLPASAILFKNSDFHTRWCLMSRPVIEMRYSLLKWNWSAPGSFIKSRISC